jgi:hypothetical protein
MKIIKKIALIIFFMAGAASSLLMLWTAAAAEDWSFPTYAVWGCIAYGLLFIACAVSLIFVKFF